MTTITAAHLAAGTWVGDPVHSAIGFGVGHMGIGKVRGTFALDSATLHLGDGGLPDGRVTAVVDAGSVHTGAAPRDDHIRSADFLDVATYPTMEFTSTEVRDVDGATFTLVGDLTMRGVTRTVELRAGYLGVVTDPSGVERAGFSATTTISRSAFGVDIDLVFGAGNVVVSDRIEITIDIEFTAGDQGA